jgi:hypothetical protein
METYQMSKFRKTEDFDFCYTDEYEEEIREHNRRERERRERVKQKDKRRADFIKEWNDLNG